MANRQNTLLIKRSNVIGKIPPISGLTLGEIALNTADAKVYTLFTSGTTGATEVRQIGWDRINRTGDTVTGDFTFNGDIINNGTITTSSLTGLTNDRVVVSDIQGTLQPTNQSLIEAYINSTGTTATLLDNTNNWTIYGEYTGSTISGTYQGQRHYNIDYFFEAVDDNDWVRLIRG
jgi:hypothetical protein